MSRNVVVGGIRATRLLASAAARSLTSLHEQFASPSADNSAPTAAIPAQTPAPMPMPALPMEPLEKRQLLAAVTLTDGVLKISGDDGKTNTLTVTTSGSNLVAKANGVSKTVATSSVKSIKLYGGDWSDKISVATSVTKGAWVDGRAGNDTISTGNGNDTVWADSGNDSIVANGGNDALNGEDGNDTIDGGSGTDSLDGGSGTDIIRNSEVGAANTSGGSTGGGSKPAPAPTPAPKPTPKPTPTPSASAPAISGLELWNADTDKKIQNLTSGQTLDLAKLPSNLTIVANGNGKTASIKFGLDSNANYRTESGSPWAIGGDIAGNLVKWSVPTGSHTIKATPYSKSAATGTAGAAKSITLNITRSGTTPAPGKPAPSKPAPSKPTPAPAPAPGTGGISPRDNSAANPNAVITAVSSKTIHAGQSVSVNAMSSSLGDGTPLTARYVWDFGDSGSQYNVISGFNASHFYSRPGTYTVKLTLTNESGKTDTATATVTVQNENRKKVYVSNDGSDSNDGLSESRPIKTFAKAVSKLNDNVEILFKSGDTFDVKEDMRIYDTNVVIGSYGGGGGKATLKYTGPRDYSNMIYLGGNGGSQRTIENLVFDSTFAGSEKDGVVQAVGAGGVGDTVMNNEFRNVGYAVNAQSAPKGLLVLNNDAPLRSGLKEYFVWSQGQDIALIGNDVSNTLYGHDVRSAGTDRLLLAHNTFANPNDPQYGDNLNRGTINIHKGSYLYAVGNNFVNGVTSVGPLGESTGVNDKGARLKWAVLEGNTTDASLMLVLHGTEHLMLRNNIFKRTNDAAVELQGFNGNYGRGVVDVAIVNNTGVNTGSRGNFLRVGGNVNGIDLVNNLYLAPSLVTGNAGSAPVAVTDSDLSSFRTITGNVWPMPTIQKYAEGGINYVYSYWSNQDGYRTPQEWEAFGQVQKDHFEDTAYNGSTLAPTGGKAPGAGVVWNGVFTDRNGKLRSNSGSWTAGAVEV